MRKTFFCLSFLIFNFAFLILPSRQALAIVDPGEDACRLTVGQQSLICAAGSVVREGRSSDPGVPKIECVNKTWFPTNKAINDQCSSVRELAGKTSMDKLQNTVVKAYQDGTVNRDSWFFTLGTVQLDTFNTWLIGCGQSLRDRPDDCAVVMEQAGSTKGGAVGGLGNTIALLYKNPPATTATYLADLRQNLGFGKPAYAQGIGFGGLSPILPIWKAMRNIAYVGFVIAFVAIGLAVLFRLKIDPRTVITVQSALPKLVVALVLVTFSYAISGFLIDLMYFLISLITQTLLTFGALPAKDAENALNNFQGSNVFQYWQFGGGMDISRAATTVGEMIGDIVDIGLLDRFGAIVGGALALFVISFMVLFSLWKLFLTLLRAYAEIILAIILAPVTIMLSAFPFNFNGVGWWLRGIVANLMAFVATFGMFMLAKILVANTSDTGWVGPLMGSSESGKLSAIISIAILTTTPAVVDMMRDALKAPAFKYGKAMDTALAFGLARGMAPGTQAVQAGTGEALARVKRLKIPGISRIAGGLHGVGARSRRWEPL